MKKIIFALAFVLIVLCSLTINICEAQWVQVSNGMAANKTISALIQYGSNIFAGLNDSGVYISTNSGTSWAQTALKNRGVYCFAINGSTLFAGTAGGGVYYTVNNGTNWSQSSFNTQYVLSITNDGNNIYAGTGNGVFYSSNNGANFSLSNLGSVAVDALFSSGSTIFAGVWDSPPGIGGVHRTFNNGANWMQFPLQVGSVRSLWVTGTNYFAGIYGAGVYFSSNSGVNWTQTSLISTTVYSLAYSGGNLFAGVNNYPSGYLGVYLTTNNGAVWVPKNQGFNGSPAVYSLLIANNYVFAGTGSQSVWRRSYSEITLGINKISEAVPSSFSLSQNYPNPFNPTTKIRFDIKKSESGSQNSEVILKIFDMLGKEVATLVNEALQPGTYSVDWNANDYPSGVYFYRIQTESYTETKSMTLIK